MWQNIYNPQTHIIKKKTISIKNANKVPIVCQQTLHEICARFQKIW